jgi:hypothetical protein
MTVITGIWICLTIVDKGAVSPERIEACKMLLEACKLRQKWIGSKRRNMEWILPSDPLAPCTYPKTVRLLYISAKISGTHV